MHHYYHIAESNNYFIFTITPEIYATFLSYDIY